MKYETPMAPNPPEFQQFDWGSIRWLVEPGRGGAERVSAGLLSFNPRSVQENHFHIGYEQIIYIISGHGRHLVNGQHADLVPGKVLHIPPFACHAMHNDTDEPLILLCLYFPLRSQNVEVQEKTTDQENYDSGTILSFLDMEALDVLLEKLSQALGFRLSLVDTFGNTIVTSSNCTPFCALLCKATRSRHCKKRLRTAIRELCSPGEKEKNQKNRGTLFMCCNSIASILIPVYSNKTVVGYIKCGEVFFSKSDAAAVSPDLKTTAERCGLTPEELLYAAKGVRVELKSVLYAAAEATLSIANYITEMASSALRRRELDKSRLSLLQEQMSTAKLEKALQEADFKLLQSQINPHFLFNTLSTVAQTAYVEGAEKVAGIVWSLSNLLRFTLRRTEELIPIHEEIKLLRDYILIQQARFGNKITVEWEIDPDLENVLIPGMLLQPLVENAIIHGLEPLLEPGKIILRLKNEGFHFFASIEDNGVGFQPETVMEQTNRIGLASIRTRLQYYFGDAFSFSLASRPGNGTRVEIRFPSRLGGPVNA